MAETRPVPPHRAPALGLDLFVLSPPPPFSRSNAAELKRGAAAVVSRYFPGAANLYAARGWRLPSSVGRVYDSGRVERVLGFRFETDFAAVLGALRAGQAMPFAHNPANVSP